MRATLIFLLAFAVMFAFFYFYPADVFESKVSGNGNELVLNLSLKNILLSKDLPEHLNPANIQSIRPTFTGFMMLLICLIALPIMIAYRTALKKKPTDSDASTN